MSKKILVVDDSETSLFLIQSIFDENEHIDFILETDGQKALEILTQNKPDLVLLDLMMPDFNGFDFLEKAKQDPQTREIPIVALTALQDVESEKRATELGAVDYIKKPIDINELEDKINQYL